MTDFPALYLEIFTGYVSLTQTLEAFEKKRRVRTCKHACRVERARYCLRGMIIKRGSHQSRRFGRPRRREFSLVCVLLETASLSLSVLLFLSVTRERWVGGWGWVRCGGKKGGRRAASSRVFKLFFRVSCVGGGRGRARDGRRCLSCFYVLCVCVCARVRTHPSKGCGGIDGRCVRVMGLWFFWGGGGPRRCFWPAGPLSPSLSLPPRPLPLPVSIVLPLGQTARPSPASSSLPPSLNPLDRCVKP